jgi:ubiquinol-cytochrome c reductase cytochrome b subunit
VLAPLRRWFDHRTGYRKLIEVLLIEHIPGGAKWRYVWGSCLAFVFLTQLITGVLLMTAYSPGDSTAWSSVYFIQYQMDFGWLIRGLHHFGSQMMVVLLGVHMLQVVIAGAHLPPREVNWWLGLGLLGAVLALSLTGYLLPWDQKGYWATQVATNIAGNQPVLGPWLQKIIVGGPLYGHHTLTRFYTLHVGILPPLVIVLIVAHLTVFRRHGVTVSVRQPTTATSVSQGIKKEGWFWPDQAFRDMVVSMIIFGVLVTLAIAHHGQPIAGTSTSSSSSASEGSPLPHSSGLAARLYNSLAHAGRDGRGANLDAPADAARPYPARPEWYFLFLFQLLKYFEGEQEIIGTVFIPVGAGLALAVLPLLGYGPMRKFGHAVGILAIVGLLVGVGTLTYLAIAKDRGDSEEAKLFRHELASADELAHRAVQLAGDGIPANGAVYLLRRDPLTQGERLFRETCASCHNYGHAIQSARANASDLAGFGNKEWIIGLLREPDNPHFLGRTKLTTMRNWVKRTRAKAKKDKSEKELDADFELVATWLGEHPRGPVPKQGEKGKFADGFRVFENHCMQCHTYRDSGGGNPKGPDFTGYGDADWIRLMVMAPSHNLRYGGRNTMPAFRDLEGPAAEVTRQELQQTRELLLKEIADTDGQLEKKKDIEQACKLAHLSDIDRELIIRWLVKDYRVVFGGEPITAPAK